MIEANFQPVAIYNNAKGKDAKILKEFKEPAWNYQVARFISHDKKDIIPRKERINTVAGIAARMISTLDKLKRPIPEELRALSKM